MTFILASSYKTAQPLIKKFKLKKDMKAKLLEIFRWEETALCVSGDGAANHSSAVGYLAGKYGITRDAGHTFLYLFEGYEYGLPYAEDYCPDFRSHPMFRVKKKHSANAAAAFQSSARFFSLEKIIIAEVPAGYSVENVAELLTAGAAPPYSIIYVEKAALDYPITKTVLAKLPKAYVIPIKHYKDIFSRAGQNFAVQKQNPQLILAVRKDKFFFPGADVCDSFGHESFYYSTQMMNCPYDCEYCYLRGMYPSANIVAFVNVADYFAEIKKLAVSPAYLSISYDSDLLSMEPLFGFVGEWINFAIDNPWLTVEIRTKSASADFLPAEPVKNIILAWTVSPKGTAAHEKNAPAPDKRMAAAKSALDNGWRVRLCIDPVLPIGEAEKDLAELYSEIQNTFADISKLEGINAGQFRMSKTYFKRIKKMGSPLFNEMEFEEKDGVMVSNFPTSIYLSNACK